MDQQQEREKGIAAIIELQLMAGIVEPRERAERGWDTMSPNARRLTMSALRFMRGESANVPM